MHASDLISFNCYKHERPITFSGISFAESDSCPACAIQAELNDLQDDHAGCQDEAIEVMNRAQEAWAAYGELLDKLAPLLSSAQREQLAPFCERIIKALGMLT